MERSRNKVLTGCFLLILTALMLLYPSECIDAARESLRLCADLLIPSLFPFFVISSLLISTETLQNLIRPMRHLTRPILGVSASGGSALLLGLTGGYPVGIRTLSQLTIRGDCTLEEAKRLSLFCNNCGPAFILGAVGVGIFHSKQIGFFLMGINALTVLFIALFFRITKGTLPPTETSAPERSPPQRFTKAFPECVGNSFSGTLIICGYVTLFMVLSSLLDHTGLLSLCQLILQEALPGEDTGCLTKCLLIGLMEVSTGLMALLEASDLSSALPLASFLLGWGGLSVHAQSLSFLQAARIPSAPYLSAKLFQGLLSAILTKTALLLFPSALPVMAAPFCPAPAGILGREILLLWSISGVYCSLQQVKKGGKERRNTL